MDCFKSLLVLLGVVLYSSHARADVLSVGPDEEYVTIQSAINAAEDGDLVAVEHGVWEEDLTVVGKSIYLNGDVDAPTDVTIRGRIYVKKGAALEMNYLAVDATGRNYGVRAGGTAKIRYSTISNGKNGIQVDRGQFVEVSESSVSSARSYGLSCSSGCETQIINSLFQGNGKAGVYIKNGRKPHSITDTTFSANKVGLAVHNTRSADNLLARCAFTSNQTGLVKRKSIFSYTDLTFSGNTIDKIER